MITTPDLKDFLGELRPGKVLDISTGKGQFVSFLKLFLGGFGELTGIDPDETALKEAALAHGSGHIRFIRMKAQELLFADGSFDMVTVSRGLHHLANLPWCLHEMSRVLVPGGLLLINEMYADVETEAQKNAVMLHHLRASMDQQLKLDHFQTYSRKELLSLPAEAGFLLERQLDFQPAEKKTTDQLLHDFEFHLEKLKQHGSYDETEKKFKALKDRITRYGTDTPRHLLLLWKKG